MILDPSEPSFEMVSPVPPPTTKHPLLFWDFIKFKVDNVFFQLPKYPFTEGSEKFASDYGLLVEPNGTPGVTSRYVVELDVKPDDFETFFNVLFAMMPISELETTQWFSVLELASKWEFLDLRKTVIRELSNIKMDPFERIRLARQYAIHSWLLSGYGELVVRSTTFSANEVELLGGDHIALKLSGIIIRRLRYGSQSSNDDIMSAFNDEFGTVTIQATRYLTKRELTEIQERKEQEAAEAAKIEAEESDRRKRLEIEEKAIKVKEEIEQIEERRKKLDEELELCTSVLGNSSARKGKKKKKPAND